MAERILLATQQRGELVTPSGNTMNIDGTAKPSPENKSFLVEKQFVIPQGDRELQPVPTEGLKELVNRITKAFPMLGLVMGGMNIDANQLLDNPTLLEEWRKAQPYLKGEVTEEDYIENSYNAYKPTTCDSKDNMDLAKGGVKYDGDKPRFDLIPPEALFAVADLFAMGAKKYADRNWEVGMRYGRVFSAMMRHAWAWWAGEEYDPDEGNHHLVSAAWCAMVLYTFMVREIGEDDRVLGDMDLVRDLYIAQRKSTADAS